MQVEEAVQIRDGDGRGSCAEKSPSWRKMKRPLGQNGVWMMETVASAISVVCVLLPASLLGMYCQRVLSIELPCYFRSHTYVVGW